MLVMKWHKVLVLQAYRNTRSMEAAKDIVQDCWQIILRKLNTINDPAKFKVWASRIVHNKAVSWVREQQKQRLVFTELEPEQILEESQNSQEQVLKTALKMLPSQQKVLLSLFYTDQYSVAEIAETLKIPNGTVKSRLFLARKHLKELIENNNSY